MLTYGGVPLVGISAGLAATVEHSLEHIDLWEFPEHDLQTSQWLDTWKRQWPGRLPRMILGRLYWPSFFIK